jgi:hypothetical protein
VKRDLFIAGSGWTDLTKKRGHFTGWGQILLIRKTIANLNGFLTGETDCMSLIFAQWDKPMTTVNAGQSAAIYLSASKKHSSTQELDDVSKKTADYLSSSTFHNGDTVTLSAAATAALAATSSTTTDSLRRVVS